MNNPILCFIVSRKFILFSLFIYLTLLVYHTLSTFVNPKVSPISTNIKNLYSEFRQPPYPKSSTKTNPPTNCRPFPTQPTQPKKPNESAKTKWNYCLSPPCLPPPGCAKNPAGELAMSTYLSTESNI